MAVSAKNAIIKANSIETQKVKIEDVFESTDVDKITVNGEDREIPKPFRIRIVDSKGEVLFDDSTRSTLNTPNWDKKFYENKSGYLTFTRGHTLLAIIQILRALNHPIAKKLDSDGELNINALKGVEFEAAIGTGEGSKFINWVQTFKANGVPTPEETKKEEKKEPTVDNSAMVEASLLNAGVQLYVREADGKFTEASQEEIDNKELEKFKKDEQGRYESLVTGLPF